MITNRVSVLLVLFALALAAPVCPALEGHGGTFSNDGTFTRLDKGIQNAYRGKRYAEMEKKAREWLAQDALNYYVWYNLANAEICQGKKEAALADLKKAVDLGFPEADHLKGDKDFAPLHEEKDWAALIEKVARNDRIVNTLPREIGAAIRAKNGKAILEKCAELAELDPGQDLDFEMACGHALLSQKDEAFACLEKAIKTKLDGRQYVTTIALKNPMLANLTGDKRFAQIVKNAKAVEESWKMQRK